MPRAFSHEWCESLQIPRTTDNQMYKMCLVSNRPAASSSSLTLGIITQSHWSQLLFHSGSVRSAYSDTTELAQTVQQCSLCLDTKKIRFPHISSRGTGSTFDISQHERRVSPRKTFSISETTVCNQCAL